MSQPRIRSDWLMPLIEAVGVTGGVMLLTWALVGIASSREPSMIRPDAEGVVTLFPYQAEIGSGAELTENEVSSMTEDQESHLDPAGFDYWYGRSVKNAEEGRLVRILVEDKHAVTWTFFAPPGTYMLVGEATGFTKFKLSAEIDGVSYDLHDVTSNQPKNEIIELSALTELSMSGNVHTVRIKVYDLDGYTSLKQIQLIPVKPEEQP